MSKLRRTQNSVPLVLTDVQEDAVKIGRLYASGKKQELLDALAIAGGEDFLTRYITEDWFDSATHTEKMDFIKSCMIECTRINKAKTAEDGIRLKVIMTTDRMAPFKDRIAWIMQEELFPHINYVKLSGMGDQRGFYLTSRQDIEMYMSYVFDNKNYMMELEFKEKLATAYRKAYLAYGDEIRNRSHSTRRYKGTRRRGYSDEFRREMTISVAA